MSKENKVKLFQSFTHRFLIFTAGLFW